VKQALSSRPTGTAAKPSRAPLALAIVIAAGAFAIVLMGMTSEAFELDRFAVPKELALNATALVCALVLAAGWKNVRATVTEAVLGAFVLWSAISALLATNHWISLRSFALTLSGVLIFLAARRIAGPASPADPYGQWAPLPDGRRLVVLNVLALGVTVGALGGVVQAYGLELPGLVEERAPGGTFGNRNFLAHLTAIGIPLVALGVLRSSRIVTRLFWLIALGVCGNAIVLTRSRAGWLGLAAAGIVAAVAMLAARGGVPSPGRPGRRMVAIIVALGAGAAAALVLPNTLRWTSDSPYTETLSRLTDYRAGSGRGRLIQYGNTLKLVARNPVFGTGPGNWFVEYPLVTTEGDPSYAGAEPIPTNPWPSSDWVALLAERGTVGLVIVLLAGATILLLTLRRVRAPDGPATLDAIVLLSLLAATTVTGLFDAVLLNAAPVFFVAAAAGLLLPRSIDVIDRPIAPRVRVAFIAIVLGVTLATVVRSAQQLAAIRIVENGGGSRDSIERALAVDPVNHRLHLRLAPGDCGNARAAVRLLPHSELAKRSVGRCG
jgi:O-antigen ligase